MSEAPKPVAELQHIQNAWDGLIVSNLVTKVLSRASSEVDKALRLAASAPHSGDWLLDPPISSVGLSCQTKPSERQSLWDAEHTSHTHAYVGKLSMPVANTFWLVERVHQDISATVK